MGGKEIFCGLSGINKTVYLSNSFIKLSVLEQAMVLTHEVQHLLRREAGLLYSPPIYASQPEVKAFIGEKNNGIPLEAGHLYWAMLTGIIDVPKEILEAFTNNEADKPSYWNSLSIKPPILQENIHHEIEDDNFSDLPFSLDFGQWEPFLF